MSSIELQNGWPRVEHSLTVEDRELHLLPHSVPSTSLEADLLESSYRVYHGKVSHLQRSAQQAIQNCIVNLVAQGNALLQQQPHLDAGQLSAQINIQWQSSSQAIRTQCRSLVIRLQEELIYRNRAIQHYCRKDES